MQILFPPGDMIWQHDRPQSRWREFRFVINQIKRAIEPHIPLSELIAGWNDISVSLSERERRRKIQLSEYPDF